MSYNRTRRSVIGATGALVTAALAGCTGDPAEEESDDESMENESMNDGSMDDESMENESMNDGSMDDESMENESMDN
ncbi:MAG: hypothetical protein U9O06_11600 [Euryarchaeota archaeon]|nr:hypothetical protein [Euryarchaeota archaeon]